MSVSIQNNINLAPLTTIQLGGEARYFCEASSTNDLQEALQWAKKKSVDVFVLGGGSNVVFPDEGFNGLVIKNNFRGIEWTDEGDYVVIKVQAGENWDSFVKETVERNLTGIEALSGIPGLVGAAPIQNIGAYGQEVAQVIESVTVIERETLQKKILNNAECDFGYRSSFFKTIAKDRYIIMEVILRLDKDIKPSILYRELREYLEEKNLPINVKNIRNSVLSLRKRKSMVLDPSDPNTRSVGSFFTNPIVTTTKLNNLQKIHPDIPHFAYQEGKVKVSAAWLIEQAGFQRGDKFEGVGISTNHALALINADRGTSSDLLDFAKKIQITVKKKFNINLEIEPEIVL